MSAPVAPIPCRDLQKRQMTDTTSQSGLEGAGSVPPPGRHSPLDEAADVPRTKPLGINTSKGDGVGPAPPEWCTLAAPTQICWTDGQSSSDERRRQCRRLTMQVLRILKMGAWSSGCQARARTVQGGRPDSALRGARGGADPRS